MTADQPLSEEHRAIEAVTMVAIDPVDPSVLAQLLEVSAARVEEMCAELAAQYEADGRGFELVRIAGGYRFQSHADLSPYVERFVLEGQTGKLSAAALETLAIVAYKQPLSRAQMTAIRGVGVDGVVRTLQHRDLICEVGRDTGPGQAVLYGTTSLFLERLGLDALDELPKLGDFVPDAEVLEALEAGLSAASMEPIEATDPALVEAEDAETVESVESDTSEPTEPNMVETAEAAEAEDVEAKEADAEEAEAAVEPIAEVETVTEEADIPVEDGESTVEDDDESDEDSADA